MPVAKSTFQESQILTRAAPTLATEGQALLDLSAITVVVSAELTRTLSGSGTLNAYLYDVDVGRWARCPGLDLTITISGVQDQAFPALLVAGARNSRVLWAASGVTVSGGTTVQISQLGYIPAHTPGYLR